MKKSNYKDYDTLTLYVKKNKSKKIIDYYKIFGWELVKEDENRRYEDLTDLTFTRPHKIKNKDDLQLQQVYMEETLNQIGRLEKRKHAKATSFGLCFGVIALALMVVGVVLGLNYTNLPMLIGGIALVAVGLILVIIGVIWLRKVYKNETLVYEQKREILEYQINEICTKVKTLSGGEYEQY